MVDIQEDLIRIGFADEGEAVRFSIISAANGIANDKRVDLSAELQRLSTARYGYEVRDSIISALVKLNESESGGGGSSPEDYAGVSIPVLYGYSGYGGTCEIVEEGE